MTDHSTTPDDTTPDPRDAVAVAVSDDEPVLDKSCLRILAALSAHGWQTRSDIARDLRMGQATVHTHLPHLDGLLNTRETNGFDGPRTEYQRKTEQVVLEFTD